jgi:hypothetical protein
VPWESGKRSLFSIFSMAVREDDEAWRPGEVCAL